ncbi:PLDc N-terminal domain-containing protein [Halocola ammonii]
MEATFWTILILALISVALWIYAIGKIVSGSIQGDGRKILWLIVVIFFPIVGAILYLLFGSKKAHR